MSDTPAPRVGRPSRPGGLSIATGCGCATRARQDDRAFDAARYSKTVLIARVSANRYSVCRFCRIGAKRLRSPDTIQLFRSDEGHFYPLSSEYPNGSYSRPVEIDE